MNALRPLTTLVVALLCACTAAPTLEQLTQAPAPHLAPGVADGVVDARDRFRGFFCASLEERRGLDAETGVDLSAAPFSTWAAWAFIGAEHDGRDVLLLEQGRLCGWLCDSRGAAASR